MHFPKRVRSEERSKTVPFPANGHQFPAETIGSLMVTQSLSPTPDSFPQSLPLTTGESRHHYLSFQQRTKRHKHGGCISASILDALPWAWNAGLKQSSYSARHLCPCIEFSTLTGTWSWLCHFYTISNEFPRRLRMPRKTKYRTGRRPVWPEVPVCTVAYVPAMVSARPLLVHLCSFALSWSTTSRKGLYHLLLTGIILGVFLTISIVCRNRRGKDSEGDQATGWWAWERHI